MIHSCLGNHNFIFTSIDLQMKYYQEGYDHDSGLGNLTAECRTADDMIDVLALPRGLDWNLEWCRSQSFLTIVSYIATSSIQVSSQP